MPRDQRSNELKVIVNRLRELYPHYFLVVYDDYEEDYDNDPRLEFSAAGEPIQLLGMAEAAKNEILQLHGGLVFGENASRSIEEANPFEEVEDEEWDEGQASV